MQHEDRRGVLAAFHHADVVTRDARRVTEGLLGQAGTLTPASYRVSEQCLEVLGHRDRLGAGTSPTPPIHEPSVYQLYLAISTRRLMMSCWMLPLNPNPLARPPKPGVTENVARDPIRLPPLPGGL